MRDDRVPHSSAVGTFVGEIPHSKAVGHQTHPSAHRARPATGGSSSAGLGEWASYPIIWLIYLYRITLAPFLATFFGGGCRYEPSCSHYAEGALRKYGAWRGSIMAIRRLSRCHPWHDGGYDPVP